MDFHTNQLTYSRYSTLSAKLIMVIMNSTDQLGAQVNWKVTDADEEH